MLANLKQRSDDRIICIRPREGTQAKSSTGLVDPRLFTGENKLHAIRDPRSIWYLKYDAGVVPPQLKVKFTNFPTLLAHVKNYYNKRNLEIVEVID